MATLEAGVCDGRLEELITFTDDNTRRLLKPYIDLSKQVVPLRQRMTKMKTIISQMHDELDGK